MIIERAGIEDAEEILDLQRLAYRSEAEIYNDYTIPPLTQTIEEIRADFKDWIFLKASADGVIIGSVRAYMQRETCLIGRLIAHPEFQNQGIGTTLMNEIERCASSGSGRVGRFELFTGHRSRRNIHLYRKLGYRAFRNERISDDLTIIFMEKRISRDPV